MPEDKTKSSLKKKIELKAISEWVSRGESVLDLGCGRGILLAELVRLKDVYAVGVDMDFEKISHCIKRGVNAYHGDIMELLRSFGDNSFDWIVCSRTLPAAAKEMLEDASRLFERVRSETDNVDLAKQALNRPHRKKNCERSLSGALGKFQANESNFCKFL